MNLLPETAITRNSIHHMDLFTLCNAMGNESVDMILCDLPYGVTECSWDTVIPMEPMWEQFKRIIKPRRAIVLTATEPFASKLRMSNLGMYKYDWVWEKNKNGNFALANIQPLAWHELILVFGRGAIEYYPVMEPHKRRSSKDSKRHYTSNIFRLNRSDDTLRKGRETRYPRSILKFNKPNPLKSVHPTQKPVALFEYLIKTYTREGDLVFDPCVGSGTTAVAARNTGRDYICGDFTREYVELARDRVQNSDPYQTSVDRKTGIKQLSLFESVAQ